MQRFFTGFVILFTVFASTAPLPTNLTEPIDTTLSIPREFPKFSQNYTFVDNSSIRENLASHGIDTEVDDLLGKDEEESKTTPEEEEVTVKPNPSEPEEDAGRKSVVEWIEDGDDTEDDKFGESSTTKINEEVEGETRTNTQQTTEEFLEPYKDGVPVIDGSVAAILVGVFLVICIFGYTALILWRRSLELKYGSREMLVDKDEMFDPDDMKHFSI